uniref:Integrase, catalytic region, zinc finger, CCHC-type, peptidase aspartic, catalytic n=1 Tax=Tanacetum cinerariifolium TaxID=118510 RepID=A0A6L2MJI9_TANCI|nr:hypothetical protein [Tanacetum cinerariifolium]
MILKSVEHGLLIWPMIEENGVTRTKRYEELSATEKTKLIVISRKIISFFKEYQLMSILSLIITKLVMIYGKEFNYQCKLINDMNIYNMKLEQFQLNTKFLNSLPPKWSKFVTDAKLVRDLDTNNFDQLHAYLEQYELYTNEVRIMREHNQDPLALVVNHQMTPSHFNTYQSSIPTIVFTISRKKDATWFRDKVLLVKAQGSGKVLNEEELDFLADPRVAKGPVTQTVITYNSAYQADDLETYDYDCDDFSIAKAVLMANLSSYRSDVLFKIRPMLYDGSVIAKETNVISIVDSEETLMLEEESRSKILLKQSDPKVLEKKVNIKPINYDELNRLSDDFVKRFVP